MSTINLRFTLRNLWKTKILSAINIGGLSTGLACCILLLLYARDELSFDRFHGNLNRIYQLTVRRFSSNGEDKHFAIAAMVQGPSFKRAIPEISAFVRVYQQSVIIKNGDRSFVENATWADGSFFTMFSFPLAGGNKTSVLGDTHSVVISESAAKKYFGNERAIGKTLEVEIDGKFQLFVVTGVAADAPENSSIRFSMVLPFRYLEEIHPDNGWMWVSYPTYLLIKPGSDIKAVTAKMNRVFAAAAKEETALNALLGYTDQFVWGLEPFADMHLSTQFEGNPGSINPIYAHILSGIAFFVLLIASINFIHLATAQSLKRSKEAGLRKALGARRIELIGQFLGETFLSCLLSFILAFLMAISILPVFNSMAGKHLSLSYLLDGRLVTGFVLLFVLTGFITGSYPAMVLSGFKPVEALYNRVKFSVNNSLGSGLIILQFSLSAFLIICTVFVSMQFTFLTQTRPGYNDRNLLVITIDNAAMDRALASVCRTAFEHTAGVEAVTMQNIGKFGGKTIAGNRQLNAVYLHVDQHYLSVMQIPLLAGRNILQGFPGDSLNSVIVNESFVREAQLQDPIGKTIDYMNFPAWDNRKVTIVGVIPDYHLFSLKEKIRPEVLTAEPSLPFGQYLVKIRSSAAIPATLQALEKKYAQLFPFRPFQFSFKDELNRLDYSSEARIKKIAGFGAVVSIILSCMGLFGITMLSVSSRIKEIGIRKLLGSGVGAICLLIARSFIIPVFIACVMAVPMALWVIRRWLENFAYKIELSWMVFAVTIIMILLIAILTVSYHAIRAALLNPARALQTN